MTAAYFTDLTLTTVDQRSKAIGNVTDEPFFEYYKIDDEKPVTKRMVLKLELIIRNSILRKEGT